MKLQQLQLKDLADWLSKAEEEDSSTQPIASDLDVVKAQVETHRKFQEELESQQEHVNSLSHNGRRSRWFGEFWTCNGGPGEPVGCAGREVVHRLQVDWKQVRIFWRKCTLFLPGSDL